jgi:hypothetical protein
MSVVGLACVPVKVKAKGKDKLITTYAFLDPGSNTSFCTQDLINRLGISGRETVLSLTTMDNENVKSKSFVVSLEVSDIQGQNVIELPTVFSRAKLPVAKEDIPSQSDVDRWPYLEGVNLHQVDANVDILIGNDVPKALEPKEIRESENGGPYAIRTLLGWTVNGPLGRQGYCARTVNRVEADVELTSQFNKFCEMEFNDLKSETVKAMSQEDKRALSQMEQSVDLVDGHYELSLPWKVFPPNLPNNRSVAEKRLAPLKKKLANSPSLHQKYTAFMNNLLEKCYARRMTEEQLSSETMAAWYLPHHSVVQPQKPEKVRVVFDCAVKFEGTSLNEQLMSGPDLTNSLVGVLTRFREETTAVMADVESMFYQVKVSSRDRGYLRFLWWPEGDLTRQPEEFQMCVHLFGGVSSPSCASFALRKTAEDNEEEFDEETVAAVKRNFYVDDCLKSVESDSKAIRLVQQLRNLLSKGGFNLTKWISNSREVIEFIPEDERAGSIR